MDKIQMYNYLNRVKPYFKRQELELEKDIDVDDDVSSNAHTTRHTDTLVHIGGNIYKSVSKIKTGGSTNSNTSIILVDY
jgi:hypothetical protein